MKARIKLAACGFLAVAALVFTGCGRPRTPHEAALDLKSPEVETRRVAASELTEHVVPPELVPELARAARVETDPDAAGSMFYSLASSGSLEGREAIVSRLEDPNGTIREAAAQALRDWHIVTAELPPDAPTPEAFSPSDPGASESSHVGVGVLVVPESGGRRPARVPARRPAAPTRAPRR